MESEGPDSTRIHCGGSKVSNALKGLHCSAPDFEDNGHCYWPEISLMSTSSKVWVAVFVGVRKDFWSRSQSNQNHADTSCQDAGNRGWQPFVDNSSYPSTNRHLYWPGSHRYALS